jgi:hypothetical protein
VAVEEIKTLKAAGADAINGSLTDVIRETSSILLLAEKREATDDPKPLTLTTP